MTTPEMAGPTVDEQRMKISENWSDENHAHCVEIANGDGAISGLVDSMCVGSPLRMFETLDTSRHVRAFFCVFRVFVELPSLSVDATDTAGTSFGRGEERDTRRPKTPPLARQLVRSGETRRALGVLECCGETTALLKS